MRHPLTWLAVLLLAVPLTAQITLDADALRLPMGSTYTFESIAMTGSMPENGIDVGPAGADRPYDLSLPLSGEISLEMVMAAIPVPEAPDAGRFPDADYVLRSDMRMPDGTTEEAYTYMLRSEHGDVALGVSTGQGITTTVEPPSLPLPLHYGQSWSAPQIPVEAEVSPGVQLLGAIDVESEVDAWGMLTLPAGEYPYLRIHQVSNGEMTYHGDPNLEAMGAITSTAQTYSWNTRYLGGVASITETTTTLGESGQPPITMTQILRLTAVDGPSSAVVAVRWGALKLMQRVQGDLRPGR